MTDTLLLLPGPRVLPAEVSRYIRTHRLERMLTVTYGFDRPREPESVWLDCGDLLRSLDDAELLYPADPYTVTVEPHADGHLHAHVALPGFVRKDAVENAWPHGFVSLRRFESPTGLAHYVTKDDRALHVLGGDAPW